MNAADFSRRSTLALAALLLLASGCSNMKKQPNARTDDPSKHFPDGTSSRLPPANTVAHGSTDRLGAEAFDNHALESVTTLPVPLTRELLARGQERYTIYCAVCHGADGYGAGIVPRRGFPHPPSFHDDRLRQANIGHFVDVMTNGYGMMYPYRDRVTESDRWAIAAYIRALQRSQHATLADVPADQLAALNATAKP
jgi:mono/diheme cytochrome c family protein